MSISALFMFGLIWFSSEITLKIRTLESLGFFPSSRQLCRLNPCCLMSFFSYAVAHTTIQKLVARL